jgi:hypothetical protein
MNLLLLTWLAPGGLFLVCGLAHPSAKASGLGVALLFWPLLAVIGIPVLIARSRRQHVSAPSAAIPVLAAGQRAQLAGKVLLALLGELVLLAALIAPVYFCVSALASS